jgi:hypothetical protein
MVIWAIGIVAMFVVATIVTLMIAAVSLTPTAPGTGANFGKPNPLLDIFPIGTVLWSWVISGLLGAVLGGHNGVRFRAKAPADVRRAA